VKSVCVCVCVCGLMACLMGGERSSEGMSADQFARSMVGPVGGVWVHSTAMLASQSA